MWIQPVSFKMDQDNFWKAKFILRKNWKTMSWFIKNHLYELIETFENDHWIIDPKDAEKALRTY